MHVAQLASNLICKLHSYAGLSEMMQKCARRTEICKLISVQPMCSVPLLHSSSPDPILHILADRIFCHSCTP